MEQANDKNIQNRITLRAILLGIFFAGLFAYLTVYFENRKSLILTATQVSVLPFVLLLFCVWLINPICHLLRAVRRFSIGEILIIYIMGSVSSGISTFGLASQLVPVIGNLFNRHWNNEQTRWDIYLEPFMSESFFLSEPGIQQAAISYRQALMSFEEQERIFTLARHLDEAEKNVQSADAKLKEIEASDEEEARKILKKNRAASAKRYADRALKTASEAWSEVEGDFDLKTVLDTYPPRIESAKKDKDEKEKALRMLEEKAYKKVEVFRRGLPRGSRAIPGFIYQPGDDLSVYLGRIVRLQHGMKGLSALRPLRKKLEKAIPPAEDFSAAYEGTAEALKSISAEDFAAAYEGTAEALKSISDSSEHLKLKKILDSQNDTLTKKIETKSLKLRDLNQERRLATAEEFDRMDAEIEALNDDLKFLKEEASELSVELEKNRREIEHIDRVVKTTKLLETLKDTVAAGPPDASELSFKLQAFTDAISGLERDPTKKELNGHIDGSAEKLKELTEAVNKARPPPADELSIEMHNVLASLKTAAAKKPNQNQSETIGRTIEELQFLKDRVESRTLEKLQKKLEKIAGQFKLFDGTLKRYMFGDIEWWDWLRPIFNWGMVILLTYVILMCFNVLIYRQWAHNEKLIFPLAELPEALAGVGEENPGMLPAIFKTGLFWFGVSISGVILGYNLFVKAQIIEGLKEISLTFGWAQFVKGTFLDGLTGSRFHIFFTMVGLSFLVPSKISFSLWLFYILYLVQLQLMVWWGYGVNEKSFPTMWWDTVNFKTAESGGAMLVFASVVLFKCRKFIFCIFTPSSLKDLDRGEQTELRVASALFGGGSILLILYLWLGMGANLFYTTFSYLIIIVITIGLIRAVAEGGILGFQCWFGPFHLIRSIFGMDKKWTSPSLYAPLMIYYSILFLDIKTFIAPAMANSIKIRDDLKMSRARFHIAIFLGIGIASVVAVISQIILAYSSGADGMNHWFHTSFPNRWLFFFFRVPSDVGNIGSGCVNIAYTYLYDRYYSYSI